MADRVGELADEIARRGEPRAQMRIGLVTETEAEAETGHHRVRLSTTGDVWLSHDADFHPHVGDKVYALMQGPTGVVVGRLGEEQAVPPIGTMMMWAGQETAVPPHYVLCDGRYLDRTEYADLFAVLGTTYGTSTSSNFRLPDLRNRFPLGAGTRGEGATGGTEEHTLTTNEMPSHTHGSAGSHSHGGSTGSGGSHSHGGNTGAEAVSMGLSTIDGVGGSNYVRAGDNTGGRYTETVAGTGHTHSIATDTQASHTHSVTTDTQASHTHGSAGSGHPHNNMPPFMTVNFIIRAET